MVAPAHVARDIIQKLNAEVNRAMQQPDVNAKLVAGGLIVVNESPASFGKFLKVEYDKYGKLARDIGIKIE